MIAAFFLFCLFNTSLAFAIDTNNSQNFQSNSLIGSLITGLITGIITIGGIFLKDTIIKRSDEKRARLASQKEIYRIYAAPLAIVCEKLVWRFSEIFIAQRHAFLMQKTLPLVFNEYKRRSTLYRIATLMGWIRAINLELNALNQGHDGANDYLAAVKMAILSIQKALADGPHIEIYRLEQICAIWNISLVSISAEKRQMIAARFEVELYNQAGDELKHDSRHLHNIPKERQIEVCLGLSNFLCKELGRAAIEVNIISESVYRSISALSYKEALIYRDWQDAIGDAMLEKDEDSDRRYKVVGYESFCNILEKNLLWIEVFRESIVDVDYSNIDPSDFRAQQLKEISSGVANLLQAIVSKNGDIVVSSDVIEMSKRLQG